MNSPDKIIGPCNSKLHRRAATNKDKDKLQKFGLYLNMYKEKRKRAVIKHEED
jgi:hypothetical protein